MKVAITGGLGFIGSHLADEFVKRGDDVTIIDTRRGAVVRGVPGTRLLPISAGLWAVSEPDRYDLVVHAAAPVGPGLVSTLGGRIAFDIIHETSSVADMCWAKRIPLVNISSSEVYGVPYHDDGPIHLHGHPDEEWPVGHVGRFTPRSEYGLAKATAENMLANMQGLRHVSIRPFNTVGPRQSAEKGFVLPTFIGQVKRGDPLTLYEPKAKRSMTSVYDFVSFIVDHWQHAIKLTDEVGPYAVNVANPYNVCTMLELAHTVISAHITATGSDGRIDEVDPRERWGDTYSFFGGKDGTKIPTADIAYALGWRPVWSLKQIVDDAYARADS